MKAWQKRATAVLLAICISTGVMAQDATSEVDIRIKEAEARMEEAARQIAELSARQMARVAEVERSIRIDDRPVLGVNVGSEGERPVEGVEILGVTPGGAAAEAGLRAGDFITAVNGEALNADTGREATGLLLDFMKGVEEGDVLDVEYLRNGKVDEVEVTPASPSGYQFAFRFDGDDFHVPNSAGAMVSKFIWMSEEGWGDMELVELSERLGSYFGTDKGLLVVRAPGNQEFQLQDGDVIRRIDGREPSSVGHAMRILGSYQSGESLQLEIMRDKREQTLDVEVPDNRQSSLTEPPHQPRGIQVHRKVVRKAEERT